MHTPINVLKNRAQRFEYKGCRVEILTEKRGGRWSWSFIINGTKARASRQTCWETPGLAADAAKAEACRYIDREI